jgi:cytochrome c1
MREGGMEGVTDATPQELADLVAYLRSLPAPIAQMQPAPPAPQQSATPPQQ